MFTTRFNAASATHTSTVDGVRRARWEVARRRV
ncbi:hypothetical protein M2436_005874 [Streptomyces sp. HB372]|nr:hypothetical protein [Streptomyces sp. HB372]